MQTARIHSYGEPLVIENIPEPSLLHGQQVIVRVGACGLCHSDLHLMNGDWKESIPLKLPITPGHEIAGCIEEIGKAVPQQFGQKGDAVAVFGGWGCGVCIHCKGGDEQSCTYANWPRIMTNGGFAEYIVVDSYRFLVKLKGQTEYSGGNCSTNNNAACLQNPDTGAIKKVKQIIMPGPGKNIAIVRIGGWGFYAIQYAKILGQSADVIAVDVRDEKLELAKDNRGSHPRIATSSSGSQLYFKNKRGGIKNYRRKGNRCVIVDCVGASRISYTTISYY